jgi:hypothetical protein
MCKSERSSHILLYFKQHIRLLLKAHISVLSFVLPNNLQPTTDNVFLIFIVDGPSVSVGRFLLSSSQIIVLIIFELPNNG